jgi:uncharacterized protein with ParB-like and HNH nuclease domain
VVVDYVLPRFQREYAWEKANWNTLLEDIFSIYEIYDPQNEPEHFMGALVVINDGTVSGTIPAFKLVDGQQRLTTISLALCALGNLLEETHPKVHRKIRAMLIHEYEEGLVRYKLLPTEKYDDRATYTAIIDGKMDVVKRETQSRIPDAYNYLHRQLKARLDSDINPEHLFLVFANCLQVVFIDLDKRERPFEIFESLNAKGKPLTQPDLVRNFIAMMIPEDQQNAAFDYWVEIENVLRESRTVSRIGELTSFLRHYLAFRKGILPNKGHVYARFRDRIQRDLPQTNTAFTQEIADLKRFATYYDRFLRPEQEPDEAIRYQLQRLQIVESVTAYPFLLDLYDRYDDNQITHADFLDALEVVENYLIRRFLANELTGYTNKMFPTLARDVNFANIQDTLRKALLRRNYPSDAQIENTFPTVSLYTSRNRERLIFLLSEVNRSLSDGTDGYTVLINEPTIEHIMPQKLTSDWKMTLGSDWEITYRDLLNTIGNLTLVTQSWNSTASNKSWEIKRQKLAEHALLLNQYHFADPTMSWTGDVIRQRATWVTERILDLWPALGESPVQVNYKGRTPTFLVILGDQKPVNSWRDVARELMESVIELVDDFDRFAYDLQTTNLSRDQKPRMEELSNGWWLYLSLSANSVMGLCNRVFEQLGLSDDDWDVVLKET